MLFLLVLFSSRKKSKSNDLLLVLEKTSIYRKINYLILVAADNRIRCKQIESKKENFVLFANDRSSVSRQNTSIWYLVCLMHKRNLFI